MLWTTSGPWLRQVLHFLGEAKNEISTRSCASILGERHSEICCEKKKETLFSKSPPSASSESCQVTEMLKAPHQHWRARIIFVTRLSTSCRGAAIAKLTTQPAQLKHAPRGHRNTRRQTQNNWVVSTNQMPKTSFTKKSRVHDKTATLESRMSVPSKKPSPTYTPRNLSLGTPPSH